jgi:predicted nuclease with RNAse H fold
MNPVVVGIDVGGEQKGFHAVVLHNGMFIDKTTNRNPTAIVAWCLDHNARVVAVDAPCRWSKSGSSRLAEREMSKQGIWCFSSPTKQRAINHDFYKWMLNGEKLYECLEFYQYPRFDGNRTDGLMCIETFPHAIVCALAGRVVSAKPKAKVRRVALQSRGYDISSLPNVDFVDAALCAVTADAFHKNSYQHYGDCDEGLIVVPRTK